MGLFISGLVNRYRATGDQTYLEEAKRISDRVLSLAHTGWSGICWGYNFDWQSRTFFLPRGKPNLIATTFVVNGLLDLYEVAPDAILIDAAQSACVFLNKDLMHREHNGSCYFSYITDKPAFVHNANLLGAAMLARVYSFTSDSVLKKIATEVSEKTVLYQHEDGAWFYGELPFQRWIDNFHTGYNLVALNKVSHFLNEPGFNEAIKKGYRFYKNTFFLKNGCPKYFHDRVYPIDIHACAQAVVTFLMLEEDIDGALSLAGRTLEWTIRHMEIKPGRFMYQRHGWWINPISYTRWEQAWMFYAMALFLCVVKNETDQQRPDHPEI